ncbi:MAG TPA: hypothetical protein VNO50_21285 [Pyrinomonadaceae bacterium]|nr:hypothetical protein [Pyrinomonadaceae bacterium]
MQRSIFISLFCKRLLITLATVTLPLVIVSHTQAKALEKRAVAEIAMVSLKEMKGIDLKNPGEVTARLRYLMKHNPKLVKVLSKEALCATLTLEERAGFGSCVKNCLKDVGISAFALIGCGVSCAMAWTGAAALPCAVCLGVSITVLNTCALGCSMYGREEILIEESLTRNQRKPRAPSRILQAKVQLKPALAQVN